MDFPVKAITALFWAMAVSALADSGNPGMAAVRFLEKVRGRQVNLEPGGDTAISPHTSEEKRREIARRLERMADDLGDDPLEAGAVRVDGELAAVLVRKAGGFDPSRLRVFPIAMSRRGAAWTPAPVPGSFENSGIGYAAALRQRLAGLENWMLREQAAELENLRELSAGHLRRNIELSLPASELRALGSKQAAERFLSACARRSLPEILGLLGGLAASPPEDWPLRLKAADAAVTSDAEMRPWRLLMSKDVLRVPVHHEEDGDNKALFSLACLDPADIGERPPGARIELIHLGISKSAEGFWHIDPPGDFIQGRNDGGESAGDDLDSELLNGFHGNLTRLHPPAPRTSARDAERTLISSLQNAAFPDLIGLIRPTSDAKANRDSLLRAARIWWTLRAPPAVRRAMHLAIKEDGGRAAALCQFFSAGHPDRLNLETIHFEKSADGWFWTPVPRPETESAFLAWQQSEAGRWRNEWQREFLKDCVEIGKLPDAGAPGEAESRAVVESWFHAIREGDVAAALRLTARANEADSGMRVLRNLGYEMTGCLRNLAMPVITGVQRGGIWTTVAVRTAPPDGKSAFPLYPLIRTPSGPRIMLEIDLFASDKRSRDFLNRTALERLRDSPALVIEELRRLLEKHQAAAIPPSRTKAGSDF